MGSRAPSGASGRRGFTLLEMAIVLCIAALLLVAVAMGLRYLSDRNTTDNLAYGLERVYEGAHAYVTRNFVQLSTARDPEVDGFEQPMQPTVAELKDARFLGHSVSDEGYTGGHWRVRIEWANPEHCPGTACNLNLLVYLDRPVMRDGRPALDLAAGAAHKAHAPAGFSSLAPHQGSLTGIQRSWSVPNPVPEQPPAVLGALHEFAASGFSIHLPRSGALPMQGDLQMTDERGQAHNIAGVKDLELSGNISAKGGISTKGMIVSKRGISSKNTIGADGNITSAKSIHAVESIYAGKDFYASRLIIPGVIVTQSGTPCEVPGALAQDRGGTVYVCSPVGHKPDTNSWEPLKPATGTMCGFGTVSGNELLATTLDSSTPCKGHNPALSCPEGYRRHLFYKGTAWTDIYVCIAE